MCSAVALCPPAPVQEVAQHTARPDLNPVVAEVNGAWLEHRGRLDHQLWAV